MEFPLLFSPISINGMELKNRIVMTGVGLGYVTEGEVSDGLIDFYTVRARGGVGLIILGAAKIDEYSGWVEQLSVEDDRFIPGLARLAKAVQSEGARVYARQCGHCHRLYEPGKMSYESWRATVKRMKRRFEPGGLPPLSPSDENALLEHLRLHSK